MSNVAGGRLAQKASSTKKGSKGKDASVGEKRKRTTFTATQKVYLQQALGDLHGQGGTLPCKQAKRGRPEGGCGVIPTEIFFIFIFIFSPKMTRFDIILK